MSSSKQHQSEAVLAQPVAISCVEREREQNASRPLSTIFALSFSFCARSLVVQRIVYLSNFQAFRIEYRKCIRSRSNPLFLIESVIESLGVKRDRLCDRKHLSASDHFSMESLKVDSIASIIDTKFWCTGQNYVYEIYCQWNRYVYMTKVRHIVHMFIRFHMNLLMVQEKSAIFTTRDDRIESGDRILKILELWSKRWHYITKH